MSDGEDFEMDGGDFEYDGGDDDADADDEQGETSLENKYYNAKGNRFSCLAS